MRGPGTSPIAIARRSASTSRLRGLMGPARSRTVVKPASSMSRAFFAAWSVRSWVRAPDLGPDRVRLVGVDHADEVDVEIHEPGHDGGAGDVQARSGPAGALGRGRHALHAAIPDHQRHVAPSAGPGPVPEAGGHEEEVVRCDVVVARGRGGRGPASGASLPHVGSAAQGPAQYRQTDAQPLHDITGGKHAHPRGRRRSRERRLRPRRHAQAGRSTHPMVRAAPAGGRA